MTPLLGVDAAQDLELIQVRRENICMGRKESVYRPLTKEQFIEKYSSVFREGVGQFEGTLHLELDETSRPVQLAARRVPVALKAQLQDELLRLERLG